MNSTEAKDGIAELVTVGPSGPSNLKPQQKIWLTRIGNSIIDALPGLFNCFRTPNYEGRNSSLADQWLRPGNWQTEQLALAKLPKPKCKVDGRTPA